MRPHDEPINPGDPAAAGPPAPSVPPRVLVVEDDPALRELLVHILTEPGYAVRAHADGEAAWAACQEEQFPLIILGRGLPGLDGLDLCRRLRARPAGDSSVIVAATGRVAPEELAAILEAGANDYLAKPFSLDLLQVRLALAERRRRADLEARLRRMAPHDVVTGLPNRVPFFDRLRDALVRSATPPIPAGTRPPSASTWTGSRRSTTPTATRSGTSS